MRIAHFADLQLGYGRFDGKVNRTRLHDFFSCFEAAVNKCIEDDVRIVLISGDVFEYPTPTTEVQASFLNWVKILADNDAQVYIISGNHDTPKTENVSHPLTLTSLVNGFQEEMQNVKSAYGKYTRLVSARHGRPSILMVPWIHGVPLTEEDFPEADICMVHCAIEGMQTPYVENCDRVAKLEWLKKFKYVALGDWHRYRKMCGSNAYYPGALERTSFGDVAAKTGGIFFTWEDGEVKDIEYWESPSRPMRDFVLDGKGFDKPTELIEWAMKEQIKNEDDIVRITVSGVDPVTVDVKDLKRKFPFLKIRWEARPAPKSLTFGPRSLVDSWKHFCKEAGLENEVMETGEDALLVVLEEDGNT